MWPDGVSVVLLSGGASRRLGRDKTRVHVGGARLLDRLLRAIPAEVPVVVAGPSADELPRPVLWTREDPPGAGPLAGIGAALALVSTPSVVVLAADMPFAVPVALAALRHLEPGDAGPVGGLGPREPALPGAPVDAVIPVDADGRRQPLCAAYRSQALRTALAALVPLAGRPVRDVLLDLRVMEWHVPSAPLIDVDTQDSLDAARARVAEEEGSDMQEWIAAVSEALGLDVACDVDAVLDVARDAAHNVERPAAPVTAYLLGAAVARGADPRQAVETLSRLAVGWGERTT